MEFHSSLFTFWCMMNLEICKEQMAQVSDQAMQATNNFTTPFMLNLYKEVASAKDESSYSRDNVLISPISIVSLLGMISSGAQGPTDEEITRILGWNDMNEVAAHSGMSRTIDSINSYTNGHNAKAYLGNAIFIKRGFRVLRRFHDAMQKHYGVKEMLSVDFSNPRTTAIINELIRNNTHGLIKESVPPGTLNSFTTLVLCNVLYFRAEWLNQFPEIQTFEDKFSVSKDQDVNVPMMFQREKFNYGYIPEIGAKVAELKYKNINTSMYVLLPDLVDQDPLKSLSLMKKKIQVNQSVIPKIDSYLSEREIDVFLPKFELTKDYNLKPYLSKLGIDKIFDAYRADLTGITGRNIGLYVSSILHKTSINVDERGSEGAAASSSVITTRTGRKNVHANRPFAFYICDKNTRAILFFGQLVDPTKSS